jgi:phosphatidylglycerophosphatase A
VPDSKGDWRKWIITVAGAGFLPAPGTWGSLFTCILLYPLLTWAGPSATHQWTIELVLMILFSALAVRLGEWGVAYFGKKDPGGFVLDEAAGICLTLLFLPARTGKPLLGILLVAFIAFRVFDITKPPPARQLEKLPAGWGILMDDLAAAIYANILCQLVVRWLLHL